MYLISHCLKETMSLHTRVDPDYKCLPL